MVLRLDLENFGMQNKMEQSDREIGKYCHLSGLN